MSKLLLFLLFPLFLKATDIKIASYNVENLFDLQNNGTEYNDYIVNKHNWKRQTYQKKLLNISEVICDLNADIIGLQEIENINVLKALQQTLHQIGCHYKYLAITHKKKSAIQVAVLSKFAIVNSREIVVSRKRKHRNILELKYFINGQALYLYVNHWSSKRSSESSRIRSARALKKRLLALPKSAEYILLGDFNSNYNEYKHLKKKLNDTAGVVGINHTLKSVLNEKLVEEKQMKKMQFIHYNAWLELPNFQRWSHNFYGKKQGLDAILLPTSMFDAKGIDYVNDSFEVFNPSYLFHKKGFIYRWQYKNGRHLGKGYSDHLPIVATFSTNPYHFDRKREKIVHGNIADFYKKELEHSLYLKEVKVIFKSRYHAIVKQHKKGRGIFVYGAEGLEQGGVYDLVVHKTKIYKGLHEVVDFSIEYSYAKSNIQPYFYRGTLNFEDRILENEVIEELEGVYKQNQLYIQGKSYPIFFKKQSSKPKDGTFLKLKRVQIGYHNALQFVVWE
jgi:endonuclease/exonuclease/phosphatase family metal-dependent hydrolase